MKTLKQSDIKVRKTWGEMNPVTRKVESKKNYQRNPKHKSKLYSDGYVD